MDLGLLSRGIDEGLGGGSDGQSSYVAVTGWMNCRVGGEDLG